VNNAGPENTSPAAARKARRRRGAQKANQNARKHGFYSRSLGPAETCEFWNNINQEGLDPELAVLRLKIRSLLQNDPGNRRALREAAKVLTKWLCARYRLDSAGGSYLKRFVRGVLEHHLDPAQEEESLQNESNVL